MTIKSILDEGKQGLINMDTFIPSQRMLIENIFETMDGKLRDYTDQRLKDEFEVWSKSNDVIKEEIMEVKND